MKINVAKQCSRTKFIQNCGNFPPSTVTGPFSRTAHDSLTIGSRGALINNFLR